MSVQSHGKPDNPIEEDVILAVETSSRVGSAALALGPRLLDQSRFTGPMQHSSELFPAIAGLLRNQGYVPMDIDQVHIAIGPGSFTGLRIAVAMAKAMHLANAAKIVTVDSLDVVAAMGELLSSRIVAAALTLVAAAHARRRSPPGGGGPTRTAAGPSSGRSSCLEAAAD